MSRLLNVLKTEPALVLGALQTLIALGVGLGLHLSAGQSGAILAATSAVLALITAASARPFQVAALTGAVTAIVTLLVAFSVPHVSIGIVSSLNAAIVAVLALVLRGHLTPNAAPAG